MCSSAPVGSTILRSLKASGCRTQRHAEPAVPLEKPLEPAVVVGVAMRQDDGAHVGDVERSGRVLNENWRGRIQQRSPILTNDGS